MFRQSSPPPQKGCLIDTLYAFVPSKNHPFRRAGSYVLYKGSQAGAILKPPCGFWSTAGVERFGIAHLARPSFSGEIGPARKPR